ncbi:PmbA protein [Burkholderiales bacterium]|nr:PmbA protein [Burkholderiales bacterium]
MAANGEEFPLATEQLQSLAAEVLARARAAGATAAETEISQAVGQNVGVRLGEVETIEYNRDKGAGITVYLGQARGHVSTADLSSDALGAAVEKALAIARYTAPDPCAGLADTALLAREWVDLELYFPWALSAEDAIELARECEAAAFAVDPRVKNSEGANVSVHQAEFVYANSAGFCGGYRSSRHGISCAVIAETRAGMQRDHWYSSARAAADLEAAPAVGRKAGERAVRRLGAKKLATRQVPVLYEAPAATSLLGHFVAAASGGNLYRKASFLLDREGSAVFSPLINLSERPHLPRGPASAPFDDEGVATRAREVVAQGVLQGYFLGSYSARKLGRQTTGNAGGAHNLLLEGGSENFLALVKRLDRGLVVTELLGQGVNLVTGDYSRGAVGFWVEHGEIVHAVEEVTIAGNLGEMYRGIVAVGSDVDVRGSRQCGSILLENMTLAGS